LLDGAGGFLLCLLTVLTPWLYGTTEEWSVRLMNVGCLSLGGIFVLVWLLDRVFAKHHLTPSGNRFSKYSSITFLALNLLLLGFCATAYFNARAVFSMADQTFTYLEYNPWLPTTYDKSLTLLTFITYMGYFALFWSAWYWLARGWERALRRGRQNPTIYNNRRFRLLMWVITVNGIVLALQATLQRATHAEKLLWLRDSWWKDPDACFGPFSYRGNAADYFNLIWPVAFGFFTLLLKHRRSSELPHARKTEGPQLLLIPGLVLLATAPFISLSRGGAVVAGLGFAGLACLFLLQGSFSFKAKVGFAALIAVIGIASWLISAESFKRRIEFQKREDTGLGGREEIYTNARQITQEYPLFGAGPGAFRSVYHLYRTDVSQQWHAFVHDDWLETRATFGWVGLSLAVLQLLALVLWILSPGRGTASQIFAGCTLISLAGTLVHAKFDFPFQTYSIFFTFVLISAIAVSGSVVKRS